MSKLTWLVVGGIGYLLGSKAGRQPYEKFTEQAQRVMQDPRVQKGTEQAKRTVKRKADEVADEVADAVTNDNADGPVTPPATGPMP